VIFTWGGGGISYFLVIGQPNGLLEKKKEKTIKTFVFWDASQLI
jgi:hypothetical protein